MTLGFEPAVELPPLPLRLRPPPFAFCALLLLPLLQPLLLPLVLLALPLVLLLPLLLNFESLLPLPALPPLPPLPPLPLLPLSPLKPRGSSEDALVGF